MTALLDRHTRPTAGGTPTRRRPPSALLVPAAVAAAVAVLPLVYLALRSMDDGPGALADILTRDRTMALVARSAALAAAVTMLSLVVGISLAWLTTRVRLPGRALWAVVAALPLAVPSYVAAYVWVAAVPTIDPYWGSVLVLTLCTYPYVFLPVAAMLRGVDPALEEVARSLGRGQFATFLTVTVRQVRPAAASGALLVALYTLSDFGVPAILRLDVLTREVFNAYRGFDQTRPAVLGLLLVALTFVIVWGEGRTRGRAGHARVGGGAARRAPYVELRPLGTAVSLGWLGSVAALALGVPLVSLVYWMVRGTSTEFDVAALSEAAIATIGVAALGALVTTLLAIPVGVLAARYRSRQVRVLEHASYAGHALPGIVVALALVFLGVRYVQPIYQETPLLVVAYAVLFLPIAVGAVRASVSAAPPVLEEVSRSLGKSPARTLREVTLPLAAPGVAAGALLVFLTVMKELPATLLLRPTGMETLATRMWANTDIAAYGAAAPYAALLILLAALPTFLLGHRRAASDSPRSRPNDDTLQRRGGRPDVEVKS